jgi:homoserine kinase
MPERVPHSDAAFSAGRCALALHALTRDPALLLDGTEDRLHQDYRAPAYTDSAALVSALRAGGVPAAISGAGPTVLALTGDGKLPAAVNVDGFAVRELECDVDGVRVEVG